MSRILIAVMPFSGHVAPFRAVVRELVRRGHEIRVYTGETFRTPLEADGATVVGWREAPDFDEHDLSRTFPALRGRPGPRQTMANLEHLFLRSGAGQLRDLLAEWRREPWDLLIGDALSTGAAFAAEDTGCRWVTLSVVPLSVPSRDLPPAGLALHPHRSRLGAARDAALRFLADTLTRSLQRAYQQTRASAGLPPSDVPFFSAWLSPQRLLVLGSPAIDYPRSDPPPNLSYVGAILTTDPDAPLPTWWDEVPTADRPVVYVTQGTQNIDPGDLLAPALLALTARRVLVVATTGRRGHTRLPFPVAENARVTDFVPQDRVMPYTLVMVTNGGWGGVLGALASGVPLIVAGGDLDKPEIGARVGWSGAGIDLRTGRPTAARVLEAYDRIAADPGYRAAAERIGEDLRSLGGAVRVADEAESLLSA
jgi:MGT family glycosyltransferase